MGNELLIDVMPFQYQILEEGDGTKRMKVKGVFQREGVANENGRIYPKGLFERKLQEKKIREKIEGRGMFGELDHPCLLSDNFRVLTTGGWKEFCDIKPGDTVWSRVGGKAVVSEVTGIVNEPYCGPAFHIKGRGIDAGFTPAHRVFGVKRPGDYDEEFYATVADIKHNFGNYAHSAIPQTAEFRIEGATYFSVPGVKGARQSKGKDFSQPLMVDAKVFAGFMGIFLSEGSCAAESGDGYGVFIYQKNEWSRKLILEDLLKKFPAEVAWTEQDAGFYTSDARLYHYLKPLGDCYQKHIPQEVKELGTEALRELLFWFTIGDGRYVASNKENNSSEENKTFKESFVEDLRKEEQAPFTRQDLFSASRELIQDLHECLVKTGSCGSLSCIEPDKDYLFAGRTIKAKNKMPLYQLHVSHSKNIWLDPRFLSINEIDHEGRIYCLSVTHGNFYLEINGNSFWTGNSDGKTSLKRVSHIITGLEIEDDGTVVGIAEILDTPSGKILQELFNSGTRVGISSRGTGSLGKDRPVVQDDYKLETWDFVANPSTSGAYPGVLSEDIEFDAVTAIKKLEEINEFVSGLTEEAVADYDSASLIELSLQLDSYEQALQKIKATEEVGGKTADEVVNLLQEEITKVRGFVHPHINYGYDEHKNHSEGGRTMPKEATGLDNSVINENLEILQEQIASIAEGNEAQLDLQKKYNAAVSIIDEMKNRFKEVIEESEALGQRLAASEDLIEELVSRLEENKAAIDENIGDQIAENEGTIEELSTYVGELEEALSDLTDRYNASVELLEAVLVKGKEAKLGSFIEGILDNHPHAEALRPMLERCQTQDEVERELALLENFGSTVGGGVSYRRGPDLEPLPNEDVNLYEEQDDQFDAGLLEPGEGDDSWLLEDVQNNEGVLLSRKVNKKLGWK